jgi:serpin B
MLGAKEKEAMSLKKSWLSIAAAATLGGGLAFAFAALISLAGGKTPQAAVSLPTPKVTLPASSPAASQVEPREPVQLAAASNKAVSNKPRSKKPESPANVELREFKHVLLRPARYMNAPQGRVQIWSREFAWEPIGEIPAGELFRFEQSLLTLDKRLLRQVQRTNGSHVVVHDTGGLFRECWRQDFPAEARQLADTRNAFAWDLYHQFRQEPGNLFFSPSSIAEALSMVLAGARGTTAAEIGRALKLDKGPADVPAAAAELRKLLVQPDPHRGFELLIANRVWAQQGFAIEQPFSATLRQDYGAEMGLVDFKNNQNAALQEMNAWTSEQTKGHLSEVITPADINKLTRLMLVNAVYFLGEWDVPFQKELTRDEPFFLDGDRQQRVPMMHRRNSLPYFHGNGFQAVSISYGKGQLAMVVMVPDQVNGLAPLEATLSRQTVDNLIAGLESAHVDLALPRMDFRSRFNLTPVLKNLGVSQGFDPARADFSGMHIPMVGGENLFIQSAIHEATVKVDEVGTVATAATAVAIAAGLPPPPPKIRADHPFLFLIHDQLTGSILFIGRVTDPAK